MTEIPKIVYDRLRPRLPELPHPDADILTAFAEQALSAAERDGVLQHLALCGDCRELVALALPATEALETARLRQQDATLIRANSTTKSTKRNWLNSARFGWPQLAWPSLRWAALAAGLAVAATVLLLHPGKLNQLAPSSASRQIASSSAPSSQVASSPAVPSPTTPSPLDHPATSSQTNQTAPKSGLQLDGRLKSRPIVSEQLVNPPYPADSTRLLAGNRKGSAQANNALAAPTALGFAPTVPGRANETVEVAAANPQVITELSTEQTLMARDDAPAIEKSKPALQDSEATGATVQAPAENATAKTHPTANAARTGLQTLAAAPAVNVALPPANQSSAQLTLAGRNVIWEITGGALQKSIDNGHNWQSALHTNRPLLCYATHDQTVWTGGQTGILFHSSDSGVTWSPVHAAVNDNSLASDITHIDLSGPQQIQVSTSNNELWVSQDGGKTWEKK